MIARPVLMAVKPPITKRLAWQLDQTRRAVFPDKRQIVGKGVAVPNVAVFHQQLYGIHTLGTGAPTYRALPGALLEHVGGAAYAV
jgi:hypothetical protein